MKLTTAIVCDDIRQESNGKAILIGVYVDEIVALQLPLILNISFFVQVKVDNETDLSLDVRTIRDDGVIFVTQNVKFQQLPADSNITMVFAGTPASFDRAGSLSLQFRQKDEDWINVVTKKIIVPPEVLNNSG